ncbi:LytTR family transcriptional regulator DNA-binding domain-containing protein [Fodinibius halophilus]|uniref:HTH LytTR-type domain-containing protein n=1 Tax=Fodinibius halophilus TaxID=1736908 RepID=A0A6M1T0I9_9BACT|nr:LytTR family transcriptional regulator DNA-binding domain-containing protein [Fodinibius halophilus]NGP87449.1 hypothetical protein [Fodinibius halophilus]
MKTIFPDIFYQPYPCDLSHTQKAKSTFVISFFVFAFLFLFAPFGLAELDINYRLYICLGYGCTSAAAIALNYYLIQPVLPNLFKESTWTVGYQILWIGWILFTISIFNSIYSAWVETAPFSFSQLLISIFYVALVGIFPVTALILVDYLRLYRKHANRAEELQHKLSALSSANGNTLTFISENKNERLQLKPDELLYLTSADNYVEIVYRINSDLKRSLLRGTLKGFEDQLKETGVIRCHRSYIVISLTSRQYFGERSRLLFKTSWHRFFCSGLPFLC